MKSSGSPNLIVLLFLISWKLHPISANDCPLSEAILPCRCSIKSEEMQIWCSHSNLPQIMEGMKEVERNIKRTIDELILENNQLPSLPGRFFGSMKVLRLMLRHNNIERLSNGWLNELEDSLVEIFLVERFLRSVPVESLSGMKNLEAITVQSEELKRLPDFSGLINLKYISVQSKALLELPPSIFRHLPKLESAHINGGLGLNRLESGLFSNLPSLKSIDLSRNGINWIHLRSLYRLPNLTSLRLSENQLSDVGMVGRVVKDLENLQKLRLDRNLINNLGEGSFVDLPSLMELHLNSNRITEIQYGSFHRTPNLRVVFLQNNHIKRIHPESFLQSSGSGVEMLYLQNNEIDRIEELRSLLDALPTLKFLELSNNFLLDIPFGALHGHGTIEQLHLDNNLIQVIDRDALIAMPALRELRLRNNSLSEALPMPFWNLPGLKGLDLSANRLRRVDSLLFTGVPSLRRLDLSENNLAFLDPTTFIHTPMLETLNISFNELSSIAPTTFRKLDRLFEIDASHNHMSGMMPGLPKIVERVSLRGNTISSLPVSASKSFNLPNLRMLDLSNNKIEYIPKYTFQSVNQLRVLSLNQNRLRSIEDSTFLGTSRIELLHLQNNQISEIQDRSFELMSNLRDLNLQGNKIEMITDNFFVNNSKLEQLDMSRNMIRELTPMIFKNMKALQIVDLSGNLLIDTPASVAELVALKDIDMSFNRLNNLQPVMIGSWKNVNEIRLSNNQITELKQDTIRNLPNLQYLDLSSNEISSIEPGALRNLPDLQELVLADNKLVELKDHVFENLPTLQAVHLQHNMLRFISPNSFFKSPSIVYLNLSTNNFHKMENVGLRNMRNLEVLDVSKNEVRVVTTMPLQVLNWLVELKIDDNQICKIQGTPFETMPRLRVLSVRNNRMKEVQEETFRNLRGNLAVLDLDGNPILCSCEMIWLSVWLDETNSPDPGPRCQNGKMLRKARLDKDMCSSSRQSQHLPLMNDHGDLFTRQISSELLSEECDDDFQEDAKQKPLPGESEYFYDQYIDYPINESSPIANAKQPSANDQKPSNINLNSTVLNTNLYNTLHTPSTQSTSSFTFFGYPLPSLNVGKFFGAARKADTRSQSPPSRGKVRMYRPTDSDLEKYLNQETQYHDITSRNRFVEVNSSENSSSEELTSFRTPFKVPEVHRGGFLPILPNRVGGFIPISDPSQNKLENPFKDIQRNYSVVEDSRFTKRITVATEPSPTTEITTSTDRREICVDCIEVKPTMPIIFEKAFPQLTEGYEPKPTVISPEPLDISSLEEDAFPVTSIPETILLIPPPDEQEGPPNYENYWKSSNDVQSYTSSPVIASDSSQFRANGRPLGRSTITKVSHPHNSNLPTAEEYFHTTTSRSIDSDVQSNEYVTTTYFDQDDLPKRNGMEWYYENYQKKQSSSQNGNLQLTIPRSRASAAEDHLYIFVIVGIFYDRVLRVFY